MSQVELEPTITAFERVKTVHALDRAAIVISLVNFTLIYSVYTAITNKPLSVHHSR
jgi:hypothetical protein